MEASVSVTIGGSNDWVSHGKKRYKLNKLPEDGPTDQAIIHLLEDIIIYDFNQVYYEIMEMPTSPVRLTERIPAEKPQTFVRSWFYL